MVGDFEVTALSDGALPVDGLLTSTTPAKVQAALSRAHLKAPVETSVNGYLINTGSKLVLIDAGATGISADARRRPRRQPEVLGVSASRSTRSTSPMQRSPRRRGHRRRQGGIPQRDRPHRQARGRLLAQQGEPRQGARCDEGFQGAQASVEALRRCRRVRTVRWPRRAGAGRQGGVGPPVAGSHRLRNREQGPEDGCSGAIPMHVAAVRFPIRGDDPDDTDSKRRRRAKAYADAAKNSHYVAVAPHPCAALASCRRWRGKTAVAAGQLLGQQMGTA